MNINDSQLEIILNSRKINKHSRNYNNNDESKINTLILDLAKIYSIETNLKWDQIEYLSLRNSLIKNIDFILKMPNLFYLDLFQNPIENYTPFLTSNTFGYLCFSPPANYFEQKILCIEKLNVFFLIADIKNHSNKKIFLQKNPNIMVFNKEIIDFNFKINIYSINQDPKKAEKDIKINNENEKNEKFNNLKIDVFYSNKFKVKNKEGCTNNKLIEIENFIKDYNNIMLNLQKDGKINYNQLKNNLEEKKKLIALSNSYLNILKLDNPNSNSYYKFIPVKEKIDINNIEYACIRHDEINLMIFKNFTIPSLKEFLLSVLVLFIFKILSKDITFELLRLILLKSHYYLEDKERKKNLDNDILNILNLESYLLICLYYKIYDIIFGVYSNKRLSDIQIMLQMNDITDKIMDVIKHQNNFIEMLNYNLDPLKKGNIIRNELILYLNQNNIFNNILMIIQYVDDYIIYNSIRKKLALQNSKDLQFFDNIKTYMYYSLDKMKDNNIQSIAEKNYIKIQMKSLFNNKYFFDTENYKKTRQYFMNVFLNYKHGIFYPNKNKINKIKNNDIEEELKNHEKEKIKELYVKNNLKSFFKIIKENNQLKFDSQTNTKYITNGRFQNDNSKNKISGNDLNIRTISNFNYNIKYLKKIKNIKNNNRKIDNIDFELAKRSHDKILKSPNIYNTLYSTQNNAFNGIDTYFYYNKNNNFNKTNIYNNLSKKELISSPINTININANHNLYKTAVNNFSKNNYKNDKLEYLKYNSMNEVLNNLDLSDKEYFIKLKNKFHKEKKNKNKSLPKYIKLKNLKFQNKNKENLTNLENEFYYNKSLGCKINCKKIILGEYNNYSVEKEPNKKIYSDFNIPKLSPVKKINKKKNNYINNKKENKVSAISFSNYEINK